MGIARKRCVLRCRDVWKEYPVANRQSLKVLRGVDLEIREGEIVVIVGPSGSGKSTLLHVLGGLDRPTQGKVEVDSEDLFALSEEKLSAFRNRKLGFVFQFHHLLHEFNALENVMMPSLLRRGTSDRAWKRAESLLRDVGLEPRQSHRPAELSGGEQQRVAVARALMNEPSLILADEPSGNLDEENSHMLHRLLVDLARKKGVAFVIATHNPDLTKRADRVLRLSEGRLVHHRHSAV